jgi:hypothetical protein
MGGMQLESGPPILEFITITGKPSDTNRNETSKKVRTQAMRDYLRKQNRQALSGVVEIVANANPEEPSQYKGRFKLNSWSHKAQTKSLQSRRVADRKLVVRPRVIELVQPQIRPSTAVAPDDSVPDVQMWQPQYPNSVFSLDTRRVDPFDSLSINLGPRSEKLLVHCEFSSFFYSPGSRKNSMSTTMLTTCFTKLRPHFLFAEFRCYEPRWGLLLPSKMRSCSAPLPVLPRRSIF